MSSTDVEKQQSPTTHNSHRGAGTRGGASRDGHRAQAAAPPGSRDGSGRRGNLTGPRAHGLPEGRKAGVAERHRGRFPWRRGAALARRTRPGRRTRHLRTGLHIQGASRSHEGPSRNRNVHEGSAGEQEPHARLKRLPLSRRGRGGRATQPPPPRPRAPPPQVPARGWKSAGHL